MSCQLLWPEVLCLLTDSEATPTRRSLFTCKGMTNIEAVEVLSYFCFAILFVDKHENILTLRARYSSKVNKIIHFVSIMSYSLFGFSRGFVLFVYNRYLNINSAL